MHMKTSSNGNIFRVTGHLCGELTGHRLIPHTQRSVTRSFDVCFELRLNKQLSKQSWGWWFETTSRSLWRHCNGHFTLDELVRLPLKQTYPCSNCSIINWATAHPQGQHIWATMIINAYITILSCKGMYIKYFTGCNLSCDICSLKSIMNVCHFIIISWQV